MTTNLSENLKVLVGSSSDTAHAVDTLSEQIAKALSNKVKGDYPSMFKSISAMEMSSFLEFEALQKSIDQKQF